MPQGKKFITDSENVRSEVEQYPGEHLEGRFGWCGYEPKWLQFMNNPLGFLVLFSLTLVTQGMLANGFYNVIITTLEQRFGFSSSEMGVITVSYDIGWLLFGLFITFHANRGHRPRILGLGIILFAIACIIFAIPHFTTAVYDYGEATGSLCKTNKTDECTPNDEDLHSYYYLFIFAMILQGIGSIPIYTISYAVLEDSLSKKKSPIYISIANAMALLGPVLGYLLGGYMLTIYVDFHVPGVTLQGKRLFDPRWVGAWWTAYLLAAAVFLIVIVTPILGFPKQFPGSAKLRTTRESEVHANSGMEITGRSNFGQSIKDMPRGFLALIQNPTFLFAILAGGSEAFVLSGYIAFLPKLIENQYNVVPSTAALYAGAISIPGGVIGSLMAGVIVSKFSLRTPQLLKMSTGFVVIVILLSPMGLYHCENPVVAGVTTGYKEAAPTSDGANLTAYCNMNCSCSEEYFVPVCQGNFSFFSACHAGCSKYNFTSQTFYDCACAENIDLTNGYCEESCDKLIPFMVVLFFVSLANFAAAMPVQVIVLRCVPDSQRSFATGIQVSVSRLLGGIPGPLVFGAVFDRICILWEEKTCPDERGSCYIYDADDLAKSLLIIVIAAKTLSAILFIFALKFYKTSVDETEGQKQTSLTHEDFAFENRTFSAGDEVKGRIMHVNENVESEYTEL